jgi:hypothetical protein
MELSERIYNGDRAREVLENEAYLAAFADTEQEILTQWKESPARDSEGREKLWMLLSLMHKLKANLQTTLETGKLAKLELEHKRSLANRVRDARSAFLQE